MAVLLCCWCVFEDRVPSRVITFIQALKFKNIFFFPLVCLLVYHRLLKCIVRYALCTFQSDGFIYSPYVQCFAGSVWQAVPPWAMREQETTQDPQQTTAVNIRSCGKALANALRRQLGSLVLLHPRLLPVSACAAEHTLKILTPKQAHWCFAVHWFLVCMLYT